MRYRLSSASGVLILVFVGSIALSSHSADRQWSADVPGSPFNLTFSVAGAAVTLAWNPPPSGDPATSFIIEAGGVAGASNLAMFDTQSSATSTTVTSVPPGTYFVRVRARNAFGVSGPSNEVVIVVGGGPAPGPCSSPAPPTGLTASGSGTAFTLQWNGVTSALEYVVEAGSTSGVANITVFNTGTSATSLSGTAPAGTYYVRVRARTACGVSAASNEVVLTLAGSVPLPPVAGVSGQWLGLGSDGVVLPNNDCVVGVDLVLDLVQSGSGVSGTATARVRQIASAGECDDPTVLGAVVSAPLTGTVSGNAISFSFETFIEEAFRIDFTGTVTGNRMGGTVIVVFVDPNESPEHGTWSVTRQ